MNGRVSKLLRQWTSMRHKPYRRPYRRAKREYSRLSWQQKSALLHGIRIFIEERK